MVQSAKPVAQLLLIIALVLPACSDTSGKRPDAAKFPVGQAELHTVQSQKLRKLMQKINELSRQGDEISLQVDELRRQYMQSLIDTAGDVVYATEQMTEQKHIKTLNPVELNEFRALSNALYTEAVNIQIEARDNNFSGLDQAYRRLDETCAACHQLFRSR